MSLVSQQTFPNVQIDIQDNEPAPLAQITILPLHLPIFFCFAAQGPVNTPYLGDGGVLQSVFGVDTFNPRKPFYQHPTLFALTAAQYQQIYFVRLIDPSAVVGTLVLQCAVTPVPEMVQYQRTSGGALVLSGSPPVPTPMLEMDGTTPVTAPGVLLTWSTRAMTTLEVTNGIAHIQPTTATVDGQTVVTYPIIATMGNSPGSAINNSGFSLYYTANYDAGLVANLTDGTDIGALTYNWVPTKLNPSLNLTSTIYDQFNDPYSPISFMPNAIDPTTNSLYDLADVITNNYATDAIPYQVQAFGANVKTIANAVLAVSPELVTLGVNPWMVNVVTGVDANSNTYEHMQVASASTSVVNQNVVLYNSGGTDGTTTKTQLESLTAEFLAGATNPLIGDNLRFPFTHIYDSGYTLANKQLLMNIWSTATGMPGRDDVKIDFSTQDVANTPNDQAQDQSTGSTLRAAILLTPESLIYGTQAIRASIYQQCGYLSQKSPYRGLVPATIDRLIKRCMYDGADHIKGSPKGRPNSEVTIFSSINWSPSSPNQKQLSWETGLNYISYCDTNRLFYADLRSVYPIDSSLLSDDVFVDRLVYLKYIARRIWTIFVGRSDPVTSLFNAIGKAIDKATNTAFGGAPATTTTVYQTAVDAALGYQLTVSIGTTGTVPNRVWKVIIPVSRASTQVTGA